MCDMLKTAQSLQYHFCSSLDPPIFFQTKKYIYNKVFSVHQFCKNEVRIQYFRNRNSLQNVRYQPHFEIVDCESFKSSREIT